MSQGCTAILILTYKSSTDTINCIRSIENCNSAPVKYIVVDNGSPDLEEVERLNRFFAQSGKTYLRLSDSDKPESKLPYFTFLASSANDGYARGNNKGLRLAVRDSSIENILVLNSDVLFTEDILPALLRVQQEKPDCGLVTPLIFSRRGTIDHCCARNAPTNWEVILPFLLFNRNRFQLLSNADKRQKILKCNPALVEQPIFPVDMPSGACMLIDKALFLDLGGFDPATFLYYEELILHKKLQAVSRTNYCVPSVKCTHLGARTTEHSPSRFLQRCNLESADHYLSHYAHPSFPQRLVWAFVKGLWLLKFSIIKTPHKG